MVNDPDFWDAVEFGILEDAKMYSDRGKRMDVNQPNARGMTPAMLAAYYGHADVLAWLATFGVDAHLRDKSGKTALDHAVASGNERCIKILSN